MGRTMALSVSRFMRGQILNVMGELRRCDRRIREGAQLQRLIGRSARYCVRRSAHVRGAHRARTARGRAARMLQRAAYFQASPVRPIR